MEIFLFLSLFHHELFRQRLSPIPGTVDIVQYFNISQWLLLIEKSLTWMIPHIHISVRQIVVYSLVQFVETC